ncbi:Right handed beta helix domain [Trypanosoma melophagium]|uniref:Right handed beta helix domain n=1 Tax=Trypanosoma melophagium TaxID=715481 RepID=UPI00351A8F08|nr:Right handed beta helix domain [Trypanosoma melophagium]
MSYREQLIEFYKKHNPAKLNEVDALLRTFAGREESMFAALRKKYKEGGIVEKNENSSLVKSDPSESNLNTALRKDDVQIELNSLIQDMESVDLDKLLRQLRGKPTVGGDLLTHALTFMKHFSSCARRFQELSKTVVHTKTTATNYDKSIQTENVETERHNVGVQAVAAVVDVDVQTDVVSHEDISSGKSSVSSPCKNGAYSSEESNSAEEEVNIARMNENIRIGLSNVAPLMHSKEAEEDEEKWFPQRRAIGRVHRLKPDTHKHSEVIGTLLAKGQVGDTDSITLQPGVYYENLSFIDSGEVEIVAAFPGALVTIKPISDLEPIIRVEGTNTRLRVSGIVFSQNDTHNTITRDSSSSQKPLITAVSAAHVEFHGCQFFQGSCAVEAIGLDTTVHLRLCVISACSFAGVFLHHGATVVSLQCSLRLCEAGIRVAGPSSFRATETVMETNTTDGVVGYAGALVTLRRCSILRNGGNGLFIASGATLVLRDCTVELNGLYGVQRLQGSLLHLKDSVMRDNALLPINNVDAA